MSRSVPDNTPVLVGAGQYTVREATTDSPTALAARAARAALADAGADGLAAAIDTIAFVRLFSDSAPTWSCPFGRSDNPPESVARAIGAAPRSRIYSRVGGNEPQSLLIEFAHDIAAGSRDAVLLTGAEAIRNQRHAERQGAALDWNERCGREMEDRGYGKNLLSAAELHNGLFVPAYFYSIVEQVLAHAAGRTVAQHRARMAALMASFSAVAAANPFAQFPGALDAAAIDAAPPLTHLYSKRIVAQDGVNQASALLLTSAGRARALGIDPARWVFLHGMADGQESLLSERVDPGRAVVAEAVLARALDMAGIDAAAIGPVDIYSCFPCAVSVIATALGLPDDGSRALTLTGGLPYFGGPGNNYAMHAIAEMVARCRREPQAFGLVTANGGMLSKHAVGVYSCRPSAVDWTRAPTCVDGSAFPRKPLAAAPGAGRIVGYTVNWAGAGPAQAIVLGETDAGERFVCCTRGDDAATVAAMLAGDACGRRIELAPPEGHTLHFRLA